MYLSAKTYLNRTLSRIRRGGLALAVLLSSIAGLGIAVLVQTPANASAGDSVLTSGQTLTSGQYLIDGNFQLTMQSDGNLVMRACNHEVWATSTWGHSGAYLIMQPDGNLVIYSNGSAIWNTATYGHSGAFVSMQGDSNLVVYSGSTALWSSGTMGAADCSDRLFDDQSMYASTPLWSVDHLHKFFITNTGVWLYSWVTNRYTWADTSCGNVYAAGIKNGDFQIYVAIGVVSCDSKTSSSGDTYLMMQKDGNVVLYTDYHASLWSTGTAGQ